MTKRNVPRFDDGTVARSDFRDGARAVRASDGDRKTLQLCAQVRRALDFALHAACEDPLFDDLEVVEVVPAPHAGRLRVTFGLTAAETGREEILPRLESARGRLTAEVAESINRRKVPELVFEVQAAR